MNTTNRYRDIDISGKEGGWVLSCEKQTLRTPQKHDICVPTRALADAVAEEWRTVKSYSPKFMPFSCIAYSALDMIPKNAGRMVDVLMAYADTDLLFYRSETSELLKRQRASWDPVLLWLKEHYGCDLHTTEGVMPIEQPKESQQRLRELLKEMDAFEMAAFASLTQSLSSLMLAFAVREKKLDAKKAFRASRIDEDYQAEHWGEDSIALGRAREIERDVESATHFLDLLKSKQ